MLQAAMTVIGNDSLTAILNPRRYISRNALSLRLDEDMLRSSSRDGDLNYRNAMEKAGQMSSGVRISRTAMLLKNTNLSIREISEQLHFCAPSHFSKVFHETQDILPQEFRKQNR